MSNGLRIVHSEMHTLKISMAAEDGLRLGGDLEHRYSYHDRDVNFVPVRIVFKWYESRLVGIETSGPIIGVKGNLLMHSGTAEFSHRQALEGTVPTWITKLFKIAQMQQSYLDYMRRYES